MDDRVRIEYQPTEGPRGEVTLQVPKVVDAQTGETLFSLWGSWFTGPIEWEAPGLLRMRMLRVASDDTVTIDIDVEERTYQVVHDELSSEHDREFLRKAFASSPLRRAPLLVVDTAVTPSELLGRLRGEWMGAYRLWLKPGAEQSESKSALLAEPSGCGRFVTLHYTWKADGRAQQGQMLLGPRRQMAWADEWHTGDGIMFCAGVSGAAGFDVLGSYGPPERPWGWRTTIDVPEPDVVVVTMWNVTPEGDEAKAVEAAYTR